MNRPENQILIEAKCADSTHRISANVSKRRVLRVWVVDDNAALRGLFAELLNKHPGTRCTRQFASAEAVLATLAEERPPDTIILDLNLAGQSGLSAIRPIKKLAPYIKVLMLSMFSNSYYEAEAFHSGASGFLLRSYSFDEITKLMQDAHRNPAAPALFPNIAQRNEAEAGLRNAGANGLGRRFSVFGELRQLCNAPFRPTVS